MQVKHIMKRAVSMALALVLLLSLCACNASEATTQAMNMMGFSSDVDHSQKLPNSAWVNSDLEGSVTEDTQENLKDDFHAAVNRDWFLENNAEGDELLTTWNKIDITLSENKAALLQQGNYYDPDPKIMSKETLGHLQELVWDLAELASDQEKRNELGVEPLRPYLEAIEKIDSLDDLTQYLKNADKTNISGENFFNFFVGSPINTRDYYTVYIAYPSHIMLPEYASYYSFGMDPYRAYQLDKTAIEHVLGELGYTPREISDVIYDCYAFERRISNLLSDKAERETQIYKDRSNKIYTMDDLARIQGNFPLTELLEDAGVSHCETFRVMEPGFLSFFGSYYKEKNLDRLKAYLMVHTILDSLPYLDETCQEISTELHEILGTNDDDTRKPPVLPEDPSDQEAMEKYEMDMLMYHYIEPLLSEAYQLAYIGSFCTSQAREELLRLVEDVRAYYVELLSTTEWLSQQTRDLAVEKVQKMAVQVMYPDVLTDYSSLDYANYKEGGNLLDAVAAIRQFQNAPSSNKVNQPVKRSDWDLASTSTLEINAYNAMNYNRIVILTGILAGNFMYDPEAPIEVNYGRLGTVIGHEISHSFDTSGYGYDAEGLPYGWWTNEDEVALRTRSDKLAAHYSKLVYMPGGSPAYNGQHVQGEAISDMGGVKCMLALAEKIPDFDYDLFFRSYASLWAFQTSYDLELKRAEGEHPLGFYRTNITLQQFDKFYETYGIGPGDGMYLAPEDRLLVW